MELLTQLVGLTVLSCVLATCSRSRCLAVGSFNVRWFTVSKSDKEDVLTIVAAIINRYDVMLMMEIRDDVNQTAVNRLWELVNATSPYGLSLSKRLGRYPRFYTEQYGFFYRIGKAHLVDAVQYDDSKNDEFEREPYSVLIKNSRRLSQPGIAFIGVHTQPKRAVREMASMAKVAYFVLRHFNTNKAVIMGDLNSSCKYMTPKALNETPLKKDKRFKWLIPDNADTTVSLTHCAYDRLIVTNLVEHSEASVFDYMRHYSLSSKEARSVSDHFPIEVGIC